MHSHLPYSSLLIASSHMASNWPRLERHSEIVDGPTSQIPATIFWPPMTATTSSNSFSHLIMAHLPGEPAAPFFFLRALRFFLGRPCLSSHSACLIISSA